MKIIFAVDDYFRQKFYHGTIEGEHGDDRDEILPASAHGGRVIFPHDTDPNYAYATTSLRGATTYAEKAHAAGPGNTYPVIYEVRPKDYGDVEDDEFYDANGRPRSIDPDNDKRSRTGWDVVRKIPWSESPWADDDRSDWR